MRQPKTETFRVTIAEPVPGEYVTVGETYTVTRRTDRRDHDARLVNDSGAGTYIRGLRLARLLATRSIVRCA